MKKNLILLIRKLLNKFCMCNCKELTIPVGPTGPQGLIGPQGPVGTCSCVTLKISSIDPPTEATAAGINTTTTGGTAPYTYLWEWADNVNSGGVIGISPWFIFASPTTADSVVIDLASYTPAFGLYPTLGSGRFGLIKCTVTDSNGNSASDTYLFIGMVPAVPA